MESESTPLHATQLDATNFPEWREKMMAFEATSGAIESRSYPGYPRWPLVKVAPRLWPPLDRSLMRRRSSSAFSGGIPPKHVVSRLLCPAHGIYADHARGPVPSAGGLQGLELYLVNFETSWLPSGAYHFDRAGNCLAQMVAGASRPDWVSCVPSLAPIAGGAMLLILVGDYGRVEAKYGARGLRFLLIEAGHLGQNLCLLASSLGLCALSLGGFFEREIARRLVLPASDEVLYAMLCGRQDREGG